MSPSKTAIRLQDLDVSLPHGEKLLSGITLEIEQGRILGVIGESGAGKSMIGATIAGVLPEGLRISQGAIAFDGQDLTQMSKSRRRALLGRSIGFIPQEPMTAMNPCLTIGQQIGEHLRRIGYARKADRIAKAVEILEEVGLDRPRDLLECYPHQLSGGMLQRVLIAMAFASNPKLVIADEPTTALDVTIQARVVQLLARMRERHNTAVLFITHDLELAAEVCDEVAVLYGGRVIETGAATTILRAPAHPYSRCLALASPQMDGPIRELMILPNTMPSAVERDRLQGCLFASRCPIVADLCHARPPALSGADPAHQTACHFPDTVAGITVPAKAQRAARAAQSDDLVLQARDLRKTYTIPDWLGRKTHVEALKGLTFEIRAGEFVGIVGESGSGKSTLTKLIVGLETLTAGSLQVVGHDRGTSTAKTARQILDQVQLVFQDPQSALNPRRRIGELVLQPLEARPDRPSAEAAEALAIQLLAKVMLPADAASRFPDQLSGGQKQRVNIARALSSNPKLLIADEIVSGLDVSVQAQILELLRDLREEAMFSLLLVSHDLAVVRYMCDRTLVMYQGEIVEQGPVEEVFSNPQHPYTKTLVAAARRTIP